MNNSNPSAVFSATNPLSDSIRLWDDPFDAPDVPDKATLRDYLVHPDRVHPDLADQIRESVNAQRALEVLRLEQGTHPTADVLKGLPRGAANDIVSSALAAQLTKLLPKQKGVLAPPRFSEKDVFLPPQPGQLWLTREEVKVWHDGRLASRWISHPPMVLITEQADTMPNGDTVVRGVAASPAAHWPSDWLVSDEIRVTTDQSDPYVAHLWLEYPVSRLQLLKPIAVLDTASLENLSVASRAFSEGLGLSDEERCGRELDPRSDGLVLLERERLAERSSWLGAVAQARRLAAEELAEATETPNRFNELLQQARLTIPLAGGDAATVHVPCLLAKAGRSDDSAAAKGYATTTALSLQPNATHWDIHLADRVPADGTCFSLRHATSGLLLGEGIITADADRAVATLACLFDPKCHVPPGDVALVIEA